MASKDQLEKKIKLLQDAVRKLQPTAKRNDQDDTDLSELPKFAIGFSQTEDNSFLVHRLKYDPETKKATVLKSENVGKNTALAEFAAKKLFFEEILFNK